MSRARIRTLRKRPGIEVGTVLPEAGAGAGTVVAIAPETGIEAGTALEIGTEAGGQKQGLVIGLEVGAETGKDISALLLLLALIPLTHHPDLAPGGDEHRARAPVGEEKYPDRGLGRRV